MADLALDPGQDEGGLTAIALLTTPTPTPRHQPPAHLRHALAGASFVTQTRFELDSLVEQAESLFPD